MIQFRLRAHVLAAPVLAATILAPGAALACNPIQFLFGGCRPQPTPQAQPAPSLEHRLDKSQRPARAKRRAATSGGSHGAKQVAIAPPQGASVGSVAHFAEDKTLRRGDVVVTPEGFLVYRGAGRTHSRDDFEPLTKARNDLATLEKASRNPGAYAPAQSTVAASAEAARTLRPVRTEPRDFQANVAQ
ncbi:MAG TPA: hypothetical protein PLB34_11780 [Rhodoblastus sp.]|nr:hypothetical protein [Rhodoblastus sp.]